MPIRRINCHQLLLRAKLQVQHTRRARALIPFYKQPLAFCTNCNIANCNIEAEADNHRESDSPFRNLVLLRPVQAEEKLCPLFPIMRTIILTSFHLILLHPSIQIMTLEMSRAGSWSGCTLTSCCWGGGWITKVAPAFSTNLLSGRV